jgi:hypothetical protein
MKYQLLIFLLLLNLSCNTTEPPPPNDGTLSISLTDASCTEAWVELKTNGVAFPININILADGNTLTQLNNLSRSDTIVYIESLLPNKSYQLLAQFGQGILSTSSNKLSVQTLDTTSNNFTWQTFTFGASNAGSSSLNDVAIISPDNIYAVGEVYLDDSTGQPDPQSYAIAHWDGSNWQLKKLYDPNNNLIPVLRGILFFSPSDIWLTDGGVYHWDGNSQKVDASFDRISLIGGTENGQSVNILWGTSSSDIYGVGYNGMITHYNGSTWQKIESGTQYDITDIWGISSMGSISKVIAVAYPPGPGESTIFSLISGSAIDTLDLPGERFGSIWTYGMKTYAGGLKTWVSTNNNWKQVLDNGYRIRGSQYNNIIGALINKIVHFNGTRWQDIVGVPSEFSTNGVSTKDNIVVAVGSIVNGGVVGQAAIAIGTRN